MNNFIEELQWRGMIHDIMPGTEEMLNKGMATAYVGIDPTADSLHIGHLVSIMMLKHFQVAGHKPLAVIGGATGMVGDPSGKSEERVLLDEATLKHNEACLKKQLLKFLDFNPALGNTAEILNNYEWTKDYSFLNFLRDIGKHISVNYMMAKDSVKKRLETGISYTEFAYQLLQGFDFLYLYQTKNCRLQMGGSDQWGNIVTGTELIRRKEGGEAFALTCPLITKSDGGKFGKTEKGNVWLDSERTSPYQFYQFWLNCSDADSEKYIKIFTLLPKEEIEKLIEENRSAPHLRVLQKALAKDITIRIHSEDEYNAAIHASQILFGQGTADVLKTISSEMLLSVFDGVPMFDISKAELKQGIAVIDLVAEKTNVFPSKSEARRTIKENALSINKEKVTETTIINDSNLINDSIILIQKGKKNYYLINAI